MDDSELPSRAWIDVDLGALLSNARTIADRAGRPLLPMIKADAYGIGALAAARALEALDPWGFGVATVAEGEELRAAGVERPIVLFTPLVGGDLAAAADACLTPTLHRPTDIAAWSRTGRPWHLAVDTGMNRAGVQWTEMADVRDAVRAAPPEGVFTHFHSAELRDGMLQRQLARFADAVAALPVRPRFVHAENSAGVQHLGRSTFDLVRPGVYLYGVGVPGLDAPPPRPVVSLRARIVDLRAVSDGETVSYLQSYRAEGARRIATVAVGYGDGYPRVLGNRGWADVRGARAPVAGLVTMDMLMLDVTDAPCAIGDVVTLIGAGDGAAPDVPQLAQLADMSPYEVLTRLRGRLPRHYRGTEAAS